MNPTTKENPMTPTTTLDGMAVTTIAGDTTVTYRLADEHNGIRDLLVNGESPSIAGTPGLHSLWQAVYGEPGGTVIALVERWAARIAR